MKVGVVGSGLVGATSAYALVMGRLRQRNITGRQKTRVERKLELTTSFTRWPSLTGKDVAFSLPRLLGGEGILATFPLPLNPSEAKALEQSARVVRTAIEEMGSSAAP